MDEELAEQDGTALFEVCSPRREDPLKVEGVRGGLLTLFVKWDAGWRGALRDGRVDLQLHPGLQELPAAAGDLQGLRAGGFTSIHPTRAMAVV